MLGAWEQSAVNRGSNVNGEKEFANATFADAKGVTEVVRWIHTRASNEELMGILAQLAADHARGDPPLFETSIVGGKLVAATYFRRLPGHVASLSGLNSLPGHEDEACELVQRAFQALQRQDYGQIQAVVDWDDVFTIKILNQAGFEKLTEVHQLWCDVRTAVLPERPAGKQERKLDWQAARDLSHEEVSALIGRSFVETLDCPRLNSLRRPEDVLQGFLEGKRLEQTDEWYVLRSDDLPVGIVFLEKHSAEMVELVYMGLDPELRGNGLGRILLGKAFKTANSAGAKILVLGVDAANWPANALYKAAGFLTHQSKAVLFHRDDLARMQ